MSWLLVVFIPGLLMLATFGMSRLEASLDEAGDPADDAAIELIERAAAESAPRPVPVADLEPAGTLPHREVPTTDCAATGAGTGVPTRVYIHHRPNPQFQPTRQADRV